MKKVKEIYYINNRKERANEFSTGFIFVLEDGSKVETMTTDIIGERYTKNHSGDSPDRCEACMYGGDGRTHNCV